MAERRLTSAGEIPPFSVSIANAEKQLRVALQKQHLEGTGLFDETPVRKGIPPMHWLDLELIEERGQIVLCPHSELITGGSRIREVALPSIDVMNIWPCPRKASGACPLPDLMSPHEPGYMPLFCAVHWIVAEGGARAATAADEALWLAAFKALADRIASEEVKVIGFRNNITEPVDGIHFASCPISSPFSGPSAEMMFGRKPYLMSYPYLDDEHWRNGFSDSLEGPAGPLWHMLQVRKADVAAYWPFRPERESGSDSRPHMRSGAPGRPTSMHLVEAEFERRRSAGSLEPTVTLEAERLSDWLRVAHPQVPQLKPKSIRIKIAPAFRAHQRAAN